MTRRKWRIKRTMAVPATWQGTPERFYHFLLGYFTPLVLWQERTNATEVAVRDSGPMNPWFELLRPGTEVELIPPGVMLERVLSHRQERVILRDWDNPTRFHRRSLDRSVHAVLARTITTESGDSDRLRITILERRPSTDYYRSASAELQGGGADWRSLPNLDAIVDSLSSIGTVRVIDSADLTPLEQVRALHATDLLVAQHGGGLSNMLWMPSGSAVLEILPPLPQTIDTIFSNLAAARRLGHRAIPQEHEHADVDPSLILAAARDVLADVPAAIPKPTGRLPMRMIRQAPRRL